MPITNIALRRRPDEEDLTFSLDLDPTLPNENTVLNHLSAGHFYEPDIAAVLLRAIQPGDTVLDVGANVGVFTLLASRLTGPSGQVVAFEPVPENLERLAANLTRNNTGNVTLIGKPASDRIEDVTFHLNSDNGGGHSLWDPGRFEPNAKSRSSPRQLMTRTTTIDAEVSRLGLAPPKVIKIDTEGAEHRVLAGATALLTECDVPYVVTELHEFGLEQMGSSQAALRAFMAGLGYDTFVLFWDGSLPKLVPPGTRLTSGFFLNILFSTQSDVAALWPADNVDPRPMRRQAPQSS